MVEPWETALEVSFLFSSLKSVLFLGQSWDKFHGPLVKKR